MMLEVKIWDVDHGSAAYIKTPTGKHIVIDLGVGDMSSGTEFSPLTQLWRHQITQIDQLIITHPHRDHLDDIGLTSHVKPMRLFANRNILEEYIKNGNKSTDQDIIQQYANLLRSYNNPVPEAEALSNTNFWGCEIQTFTPVYSGPNLNNYSLVTVVGYAGSKIIIPGDNEGASWKSLLEQPKFVEAIKGTDIFVASHHGRESGFYGELFDHFKPSLVVISDTNHGDTSVTGNYSYHATGWKVKKGSTGQLGATKSYCLTTRVNGTITIKCGQNLNQRNYREVSTEI